MLYIVSETIKRVDDDVDLTSAMHRCQNPLVTLGDEDGRKAFS